MDETNFFLYGNTEIADTIFYSVYGQTGDQKEAAAPSGGIIKLFMQANLGNNLFNGGIQ